MTDGKDNSHDKQYLLPGLFKGISIFTGMSIDDMKPYPDPGLDRGIVFLKIAAISPGLETLSRRWTALIVAVNTSGILVLTYSFYIYLDDLDKVAVIVHHAILMFTVACLTLHYWFRRNIVSRVFEAMKTTFDYKAHDLRNEIDFELNQRRIWNNKVVRLLYASVSYTILNVFISSLLDLNADNSILKLFPCWWPLDLNDPFNYGVFLTWQLSIIFTAVFVIFGVLGISYFVYAYTLTELKVLNLTLRGVKGSGQKKDLASIHAITQCVKHHHKIIAFFEEAQMILAVIHLFILTVGVGVMTMTGFAIISENVSIKIKFFGILLTQLIFIYIACWFSEEIKDASLQLRYSAYDVEWLDLPPEALSTLRLIIERSFRPLQFKAATGNELSLETYMSMMKASYSYFNMLLASRN